MNLITRTATPLVFAGLFAFALLTGCEEQSPPPPTPPAPTTTAPTLQEKAEPAAEQTGEALDSATEKVEEAAEESMP